MHFKNSREAMTALNVRMILYDYFQAEDAVCLADYCDIMRCQVLVAHGLLSGGVGPVTDIEVRWLVT